MHWLLYAQGLSLWFILPQKLGRIHRLYQELNHGHLVCNLCHLHNSK